MVKLRGNRVKFPTGLVASARRNRLSRAHKDSYRDIMDVQPEAPGRNDTEVDVLKYELEFYRKREEQLCDLVEDMLRDLRNMEKELDDSTPPPPLPAAPALPPAVYYGTPPLTIPVVNLGCDLKVNGAGTPLQRRLRVLNDAIGPDPLLLPSIPAAPPMPARYGVSDVGRFYFLNQPTSRCCQYYGTGRYLTAWADGDGPLSLYITPCLVPRHTFARTYTYLWENNTSDKIFPRQRTRPVVNLDDGNNIAPITMTFKFKCRFGRITDYISQDPTRVSSAFKTPLVPPLVSIPTWLERQKELFLRRMPKNFSERWETRCQGIAARRLKRSNFNAKKWAKFWDFKLARIEDRQAKLLRKISREYETDFNPPNIPPPNPAEPSRPAAPFKTNEHNLCDAAFSKFPLFVYKEGHFIHKVETGIVDSLKTACDAVFKTRCSTMKVTYDQYLYGVLRMDALFQPRTIKLLSTLRIKATRYLAEFDCSNYTSEQIADIIERTVLAVYIPSDRQLKRINILTKPAVVRKLELYNAVLA